jgi:hypothetical protein
MIRRLLALWMPFVMCASCALVAPPKVQCVELGAEQCTTAALAIAAEMGLAHPIQRMGLYGYRGCLGYCPLQTPQQLEAIGAVDFADDTPDAVVTADGLEEGSVTIVPTEGFTSPQVIRMAGSPK